MFLHYTIAITSVANIDLTSVILEKDKEASKRYGNQINLKEFLSAK